jgi:HD-GYP domain-containing protein (c-di-GMP phosphodiesterase class II)
MDRPGMFPRLVGSVDTLTVALEVRDAYTRSHCDRVVRLATELGNACDVLDAELDHLRVAARFHDVGKIGVPDQILRKPGKLTDDEWACMKAHAALGERIFRATNLPDQADIADAIRHHHEAYDGSGYPDQLVGEAIPLASRILLVVDAYDAITSSRPYAEARSHVKAMEILKSDSGRKLDPGVFGRFERLIEHSPARAS